MSKIGDLGVLLREMDHYYGLTDKIAEAQPKEPAAQEHMPGLVEEYNWRITCHMDDEEIAFLVNRQEDRDVLAQKNLWLATRYVAKKYSPQGTENSTAECLKVLDALKQEELVFNSLDGAVLDGTENFAEIVAQSQVVEDEIRIDLYVRR